jgi:hypothetical protein
MGKAPLHRFFKNEFLQAVEAVDREGVELREAEQRILEIDHAAAGALVAFRWHLPPLSVHTIEYHHSPLALPEQVDGLIHKTGAIVHRADALADHYEIGRGVEVDVILMMTLCGITLVKSRSLQSASRRRVGGNKRIRKIFDISGGGKSTIRTLPRRKPTSAPHMTDTPITT